MSSEGLLAVTDYENHCVHLLSNDGKFVRSIGKEVMNDEYGVAFDKKGNIWVTHWDNNKVVKLSEGGQVFQTICHVAGEHDCFSSPRGLCISSESQIYICDFNNHRLTVHDEEGKFLYAFGSKGSGPGHFDGPGDVAFGSDGLLYVIDFWNERVCVWSKEGNFQRDFKTKYGPRCIAASSDNHLLITSFSSHYVMVYTLDGELIHEFGGKGSDPGKFDGSLGICIDENGLVYIVDRLNQRVQVFS